MLLKILPCLFAALISFSSTAAHAQATTPPPALNTQDTGKSSLPWVDSYTEGSASAPLEITIYYIPTSFYSAQMLLPYRTWLKNNYVDKDRIRLRYVELADSDTAKKMFAILHCIPRDNYMNALTDLYSAMNKDITMQKAAGGADPLSRKCDNTGCKQYVDNLWGSLKTENDSGSACLKDTKLRAWRNSEQKTATRYLSVRGLPVFILGASPYRLNRWSTPESFSRLIDGYLNDMNQKR